MHRVPDARPPSPNEPQAFLRTAVGAGLLTRAALGDAGGQAKALRGIQLQDRGQVFPSLSFLSRKTGRPVTCRHCSGVLGILPVKGHVGACRTAGIRHHCPLAPRTQHVLGTTIVQQV